MMAESWSDSYIFPETFFQCKSYFELNKKFALIKTTSLCKLVIVIPTPCQSIELIPSQGLI